MDDLRQLREESLQLKQMNQTLGERVAAAEVLVKQLIELLAPHH